MSRILMLPCHEVLERDELDLYLSLGHHVFSPGSFVSPQNRGDQHLRPGIAGFANDPDEEAHFHSLAIPGIDQKAHLTKEFVDRFDAVVIHHMPEWVVSNWEAIKHKRVIWRTIGQSIAHQEQMLKPYREQGLQIVRYSPAEERIPGYLGHDAIIRFAKNPDEWTGWRGDTSAVLHLAQDPIIRARACSYDFYERVTRPFARTLMGNGTQAVSWGKGRVSYDEMREALRSHRVFFFTGTHPASYTLGFIEAWMTGIPVVSIGRIHGNDPLAYPNHYLFEVPELLGGAGFASDDPYALKDMISGLLRDQREAETMGRLGRMKAIELFGVETIRSHWKRFLG